MVAPVRQTLGIALLLTALASCVFYVAVGQPLPRPPVSMDPRPSVVDLPPALAELSPWASAWAQQARRRPVSHVRLNGQVAKVVQVAGAQVLCPPAPQRRCLLHRVYSRGLIIVARPRASLTGLGGRP
jgi:hypothetical protein